MTTSPTSSASVTPAPVPGMSVSEIKASCRLPLLVLFISAAIWLVIGSLLGVIASLKFHMPSFLADSPWLTYGRVRPAYWNALLYGFCLQGGMGVMLWMFAWLGRTRIVQSWLVLLGAKVWNLGVTVGVLGILAGDSTGFEGLEMPRYAAIILFLGYLMIGVWAAMTFHNRADKRLLPSQWFLVAALFWFPWIYSTANLLLITFPVRGMAQPVIAWWYASNLQTIWLGCVGLGALYYFIPKFSGRPLQSHYMALFAFWTLLLIGGWTGIPNTAPVPAWIPALSTVATTLMVVPLIAVAMNLYGTAGRAFVAPEGNAVQSFFVVATGAFIIAGLLRIITALTGLTDFTWFVPGTSHLLLFGFFGFIIFGAAYHIIPEVTGIELPCLKMARTHFWLVTAGLVVLVAPMILGGILQGVKLQDGNLAFPEIMKFTLGFLRITTLGDLLILAGSLVFLCNLGGLVVRLYKARATAAYMSATAEIQPAKLTP